MSDTILQIRDLSIAFPHEDGTPKKVVDGISFSIDRGKTLGLVGESGSGKSMCALSIMRLIPTPGRVSSGQILLNDENVAAKSAREMRLIRGGSVSIVFQDPLSSLNPVRPIGALLVQSAQLHQGCSRKEAWNRAAEMLKAVGIPNAPTRMKSYPHEFSGGQRQRIMIALAAMNAPSLIIADEPTTALDTTIQMHLLELLKFVTRNSALLMITHDLGVASAICDELVVMRGGRVVESGLVTDILSNPRERYTKALVDAVPRFTGKNFKIFSAPAAAAPRPLLKVRDLEVTYELAGQSFKAVENVSLSVAANETLGIVGESGSGKSTIAKAVMQMVPVTGGEITFDGKAYAESTKRHTKELKCRMQYIFQDPYSSLDPRWIVKRIIAEPMRVHGLGGRAEINDRVAELLNQMELPASAADRRPAEFSGGQRQRIGLARALSVRPDILIADEPVSALDVTIQRKMLELLKRVQWEYKLALIFIAHDLPLVYQLTDRVAVLYLGQIVEEGPTKQVLGAPRHPYTAALKWASEAALNEEGDGLKIKGEPASPLDPPAGCPFHPRCPIARPKCSTEIPVLTKSEEGVSVACHFPLI